MGTEKILIIGSCGQLGTELVESLRGIYGDANVIASDLKKADNPVFDGGPFEELDILDLNRSIAVTNNQDVKLVYDFLNKGSRNHLRSFYKNLTNAGGTYVPIFITQADFDAIINSPTEKM